MENVQRICEQCGAAGPLEARHCPHCGHDSQADQLPNDERDLPMRHNSLPMIVGKAALPLVAGAASLLLRAGWKVLQNRLRETKPEQAASFFQQVAKQNATQAPLHKGRRTIHIRSSWAVGDSDGNWQRGSSEHTIDLDD